MATALLVLSHHLRLNHVRSSFIPSFESKESAADRFRDRGAHPSLKLEGRDLLRRSEVITLDSDCSVFPQRHLEQFVYWFRTPESIERESEQTLLDIKTHQPGRHIQGHESGVQSLPAEQGREIRRIVGDEHVTVGDRAAYDRPVGARAQAAPRNMRRFLVTTRVRERDELRTQAFVDQELHARTRSSKPTVSECFGTRGRRGAFTRG